MRPQAKTIQIFLPDGNARGIRIADITSETVHAIQIPRSQIKDAKSRKEVHQVGTYFLFGEQNEIGNTPAYIGEAENCFDRIVQHDSKKPFWTTAIILTSKTLSFTKTHAKYLEWYALSEAQKVAGRFHLEPLYSSSHSFTTFQNYRHSYTVNTTTRQVRLAIQERQAASSPAFFVYA